MASQFGQSFIGTRDVMRREQDTESQLIARQTQAVNTAIGEQLKITGQFVKSFQEGKYNGTPEQFQEQIDSLIAPAIRTAQIAKQSGIQSHSPEQLESFRQALLKSATPTQISQTQGQAKGTGLISEAQAVSEGGGIPLTEAQQARGLRPKGPSTIVNVNLADNEFVKMIGKEGAKDVFKSRQDAIDAASSLRSIGEARKLLDEGMTSGAFANWTVGLGKTLRQIGFNESNKDIDNAQAFGAAQAKQVASIIKAFGAGTGLSDADREFATRAAAGDIEMTEGAIRKILDINQRAYTNIINLHNQKVKGIKPELLKAAPFELTIQTPEIYKSTEKSASPAGLSPEGRAAYEKYK